MPGILRKNSNASPEVRELQRELKRQIAPDLKVDGVFGDDTEAAVRRFQISVGFKGKDVDGTVGPKTTMALAQTFDLKIQGRLQFDMRLELKPPVIPSFKDFQASRTPQLGSQKPLVIPSPKDFLANRASQPDGKTVLVPPPPPIKTTEPNKTEPVPKTFTGNLQLGKQGSEREGIGYQLQLFGTFRSKGYFPGSSPESFYHGTHVEIMPSLTFGIPFPHGSLVTGQIGVTIQPLTDWLVIQNRWHLLTPSVGGYGQIPLDPKEGKANDPGTHSRAGGNVGLELFHYDITDTLAVGISGQESFYWDFKDRKLWWDPTIMGFGQWNFGGL